jgi:DNA-binding transcriptional LysR family regulator
MGLRPTKLPKVGWERQIGRRLRLRDLHVFFTVVQHGSMGKAAQQLGVSQPAVSEVIADLEHALGVRLLDRLPHGVAPTMYGAALTSRSIAVFDELKQGISDIEFLADPTRGELHIGCPEPITTILLPIMEHFTAQHPGVLIHVGSIDPETFDLPRLRERRFDFILALTSPGFSHEDFGSDLNFEVLFNETHVVVAGRNSQWARRRNIELAELVEERWILATPGAWLHKAVLEAFRARGLGLPRTSVMTFSMFLRASMAASGNFIATFPSLIARHVADRFSLKVLPVDLRLPPSPFGIGTLKNRTLSPVVERFIEHAREVGKAMHDESQKKARRAG